MNYKDMIKEQREKWIGKRVLFQNNEYTVADVDYNGSLLINKPAEFTNTTAVPMWMVKQV